MEGGSDVLVADPDSPPVGSPETAAAAANFDEVSKPAVQKHKSSNTVKLTDDLRQKIIKQVEYYFSDENLKTDKFLMNYITKDKDGYVPISVIATFRKLKRLAPDRSLIVAALKDSSQLVLSSSKKNVRRLNPLHFNEVKDPQLCTVLVENLPEDHSLENIRRIFSEAGNIKDISIRDPNVSSETKSLSVAEKLLSGKLHALVEYENVESAEKAVVALNDERDWRYGMRVKLLKKQAKHGQRSAWREAGSEKHTSAQTSDSAGEKENVSSEQHNDAPDDDEEDGEHLAKEKNGNRTRNRGRTRNPKYRGSNGHGHGNVLLNHVGETSKPPPGPRMPDGTRGFTMGRGRPPSAPQN